MKEYRKQNFNQLSHNRPKPPKLQNTSCKTRHYTQTTDVTLGSLLDSRSGTALLPTQSASQYLGNEIKELSRNSVFYQTEVKPKLWRRNTLENGVTK